MRPKPFQPCNSNSLLPHLIFHLDFRDILRQNLVWCECVCVFVVWCMIPLCVSVDIVTHKYSCHSWGTARTAAPSNHCLIDLLEQRWPLCFHLYAWRFPEAVHPQIFLTSLPSSFLPFTPLCPYSVNLTLNYPTTGSRSVLKWTSLSE